MSSETTKNHIKHILGFLSIAFDSIDVLEKETRTVFMIKTNDKYTLISNNGEALLALNHVIKKMVGKNSEEIPAFTVDVNDYQERKNKELHDKAIILAERAKSFSTNIEMDPMSSYERMVVHAALSEDPEIETESAGYGRERRVVIKYKQPTTND